MSPLSSVNFPGVPPPTNSVCMEPKDSGPCMALFPRWFYNQQTGQCEEFTYGGCSGNKNNFKTKNDCEKACGNGKKLLLRHVTSPFLESKSLLICLGWT
ncbi:hypothetical protein AVEN_107637-1 [Araneus ventricosus]|uniref:BPTI/Kunitz inhibitor domain-containing protein n=1 Tax=Araneus ventricosus TaxID=182803 RepID=A0A4Y2AA33_ARAVE|nr:hypothetical protein AVEN_106515-1 [Araneus ventricosus]GBL76667.1 hypothetical protein AVEN_107637-1 [Araneus ventricosus]